VNRWTYHLERFGTLPSQSDDRLARIEIALHRQFSGEVDEIAGVERCIELGRNGWKLVTIFPDSGYLVAIFKRPAAETIVP
jgi:hypothetical protein